MKCHCDRGALSRRQFLAAGRYVFRGFYGTYDATFTANGRTVTRQIRLAKDGDRTQEIRI